MTQVDVSVEIAINADPADIAAVMFNPHRDSEWMKAVRKSEPLDESIAIGARVKRSGSFLGQEIQWTTEVATIHFPHRLVLKIADGPFVGTVTYDIQRSGDGSVARIRNVGSPTKFGFLPAAMIEAPMRSALNADLERLKQIVENKS